jgi:hypothetical protein
MSSIIRRNRTSGDRDRALNGEDRTDTPLPRNRPRIANQIAWAHSIVPISSLQCISARFRCFTPVPEDQAIGDASVLAAVTRLQLDPWWDPWLWRDAKADGAIAAPATWRAATTPADRFRRWFEGCLDGHWDAFDPRNEVPRRGRALIARGRDVCDVAISRTFAANTLPASAYGLTRCAKHEQSISTAWPQLRAVKPLGAIGSVEADFSLLQQRQFSQRRFSSGPRLGRASTGYRCTTLMDPSGTSERHCGNPLGNDGENYESPRRW